jgi:hypothetical protein
MDSISASDLYAMLSANRELIANTWHFFVSVHMGVVAALLLARHEGERRPQLLLLIPFYIGFMYLNFRAQIDNYEISRRLIGYIEQYEKNEGVPKIIATLFEAGWVMPFLAPIFWATGSFTALLIIAASAARGRAR